LNNVNSPLHYSDHSIASIIFSTDWAAKAISAVEGVDEDVATGSINSVVLFPLLPA
jgi:hypothetical protein